MIVKESTNIGSKSLLTEYCIQGNIRPYFIFAPFALVDSGLIKDWANFNVSDYLSFNKTFELKTGKRRQLLGANSFLYTVVYIHQRTLTVKFNNDQSTQWLCS